MAPLEEVEQAYLEARQDPSFDREWRDLLENYAGRPTPLYFARRLSESLGGASGRAQGEGCAVRTSRSVSYPWVRRRPRIPSYTTGSMVRVRERIHR